MHTSLPLAWRRLRLGPADWRRAIVAGTAFGLTLTVALTAFSAWQCGGICPAEVVETLSLSLLAGLVGLGPVAAYGGR